MDLVAQFDPEMARLVAAEERRQRDTVNLIASENYASPLALALEGSIFANKNAEGYPGKRFVAGCEHADAVERLAVARLKDLFGCEHANVQAMSATIANVALLGTVLEPGDRLLGMRLADGGHLSHGAEFHLSGKTFEAVHYGVDRQTERIDMDRVADSAKRHRPKLIICGGSAYPRAIDYGAFGEIARSVGALLWADVAHTAGLIAAGVVPSPLPHADFVTTSTHKTWRGPRGFGVILCRKDWAERIDRALFPGIQGAPKMDMIAARAVFFKECATPEFREYARQVLDNAKALAEGLTEGGIRLVSGGTDTHLILADVRGQVPDGARAEALLAEVGIIANKNPIPFDPAPPTVSSGLRVGTAAMTTRGLETEKFRKIGALIARVLTDAKDPTVAEAARAEVANLVLDRPLFARRWLPAELQHHGDF